MLLLGPPELQAHLQTVSAGSTDQTQALPGTSEYGTLITDEIIQLINSTYETLRLKPEDFPNNSLVASSKFVTENKSPTFFSTGDPCLDFFFLVVPTTSPKEMKMRLELAWNHDPLTTLKLICNLRGVRGTGKSDKEGYYSAALWLHQLHPKTFACNVESFANFGYYKDLLEVLYRLLEGPYVRTIAKMKRPKKYSKNKNKWIKIIKRREERIKKEKKFKSRGLYETVKNFIFSSEKHKAKRRMEAAKKDIERGKEAKKAARIMRKQKTLDMAKKAVGRYNHDSEFKFLHDRISDLFAEHLKSDLQNLKSGKPFIISLAAKWCPSLDSSYDQSTLICESIAQKVFPKSSPEYENVQDARYAYRVRDRLRKEVLVPLRRTLEMPELFMSANQWGELPYNRVPSVAMKTYKELFTKHDKERFDKYLEDVKAGKSTIAAGTLFPHEVIASLDDEDGGKVAELQWKRIVDDLSKIGKMKNCLAVSDVSGSMKGTPMEVSIALGILISELCEEPWKGKIITFSKEPKLHQIAGDDLKSKVRFVRQMEFGMNTNFQKVFDVILKVAVKRKLSQEAMIKRVFVFSDMEFDRASANPWETDYEAITRKFKENGYENAVPEIIFWNLRNSKAIPVPSIQKNVALVSGFSKNLVKLFLKNGGSISPLAVMEAAISGKEYEKLKVID